MTIKVYLRELAAVCKEASESDDPRVIELAMALLERAGEWARVYHGRYSTGSLTLIYARPESVWHGVTQ